MSGPQLFTFAGLQASQTWTGTPFFALLTRPVMGVSRMGRSVAAWWAGIGLMGLLLLLLWWWCWWW